MRLTQAQCIGRGSLTTSFIQILSVWTSRPLLSSARSYSCLIRLRAKASLASFVSFGSLLHRLLPRHSFATTYHLTLSILHMKLIHFIVKSSGTNRTTLENTKLLLIKDLRVSECLISSRGSKLRWTNNLLGHHEIILLRSIDTLLRLNGANSELSLLHISHANLPNLTESILTNEWLDVPLSILGIFWRDFGTVTFEPNHSARNTNYLVLIIRRWVLLRLALTLISHSSYHHISGLILIWLLIRHHNNIIFFYDGDSLLLILRVLLWSLNYVTSHHLLFILHKRKVIIENIVIVINIFDNLYWLLILLSLTLFFWLRGTWSSRSMRTV